MASVFVFNQTGSPADVIINNGNQIQIAGTSDTADWVANTAVKVYQSPGTVPGNLNSGQNKVEVSLDNDQNFFYSFNLPGGAGSVQMHILAADNTGTVPALIVLVEGLPVTSTTGIIAGTPPANFVA